MLSPWCGFIEIKRHDLNGEFATHVAHGANGNTSSTGGHFRDLFRRAKSLGAGAALPPKTDLVRKKTFRITYFSECASVGSECLCFGPCS